MKIRKIIKISGIISSKAFVSYISSLASKFKLSGWIKGSNECINMEVEGDKIAVTDFISNLNYESKPVTNVVELDYDEVPAIGSNDFLVMENESEFNYVEAILQDVAICDDCVKKLFNPDSRKYHYPFIACDKCGPRYSIIDSFPFTKEHSSLGRFECCDKCNDDINKGIFETSFSNCPDCGPRVWLKIKDKPVYDQKQTFKNAAKIIAQGGVLLLKSTNCFYLCANAFSDNAVEKIRAIKARENKPLTIMAKDIQEVERFAHVSDLEKELLMSKERPIVVLKLKDKKYLAPNVTVGFNKIGVMLPYNPIQHILFESGKFNILVMSSANRGGVSIETDNEKAEAEFGSVVNGILQHNLDICNGSDDSILAVVNDKKYSLRLARGYAPNSVNVKIADNCPTILACGAHHNSTFALSTPDGRIHVSPYMGDLDSSNVFDLYKKNMQLFCKVFNVAPEYAICDLHPDYYSTKYVKTLKIPYLQMQHDWAHIVSCLVDNNLPITTPVIGVVFDGSGYGTDQTIWGGEFIVSKDLDYTRVNNIPIFKMIGYKGKESQIYRLGYSLLKKVGIPENHQAYKNLNISREEENMFSSQLNTGVNSPLTSSAAKLFDAVAAIVGLARYSYYEEYSALYLESLADENCRDIYPIKDFNIKNINALIQHIVKDIERKESVNKTLARFHNTLAKMIAHTCKEISKKNAIKDVALSGSVWMNTLLLERTISELEKSGLKPLIHKNVSPNDEGLSLGQAAYMVYKISQSRNLAESPKNNKKSGILTR